MDDDPAIGIDISLPVRPKALDHGGNGAQFLIFDAPIQTAPVASSQQEIEEDQKCREDPLRLGRKPCQERRRQGGQRQPKDDQEE